MFGVEISLLIRNKYSLNNFVIKTQIKSCDSSSTLHSYIVQISYNIYFILTYLVFKNSKLARIKVYWIVEQASVSIQRKYSWFLHLAICKMALTFLHNYEKGAWRYKKKIERARDNFVEWRQIFDHLSNKLVWKYRIRWTW